MKASILLINRSLKINLLNFKNFRNIFDVVGIESKNCFKIYNLFFLDLEILSNRGDNISISDISREFISYFFIDFNYLNFFFIKFFKLFLYKNKRIYITTKYCLNYCLIKVNFFFFNFFKNYNYFFHNYLRHYLFNKEDHFLLNLLNFITYFLGQPFQLYDEDKIEGNIFIEISNKDERIIITGDKELLILKDSLIIRDSKKIISLAGIACCRDSFISNKTTNFLIEFASFDPYLIKKVSKKLKLSTVSSLIFEKGINPELVKFFFIFFYSSLIDLKINFYFSCYFYYNFFSCKELDLSFFLLKKKIGISINKKNIYIFFSFLNVYKYKIKEFKSSFIIVVPPSFRYWNMDSNNNILEDFIKLIGFNFFYYKSKNKALIEKKIIIKDEIIIKIASLLLNNGFNEIITKSYYSNNISNIYKDYKYFPNSVVKIINSENSSFSNMRISNLVNMLNYYIEKKNNEKEINCKIFEFGKIFFKDIFNNFVEKEKIFIFFCGNWFDGNFRKYSFNLLDSFFIFKGLIESILFIFFNYFAFKISKLEILDNNFQLSFLINAKEICFLGLLNEKIVNLFDLQKINIFYSELDISLIKQISVQKFYTREKAKNLIFRDLTFLLRSDYFSYNLIKYLNLFNFLLIYEINIIDLYSETGAKEKNVTYRIFFNVTDVENYNRIIDNNIKKIIFLVRKNLVFYF